MTERRLEQALGYTFRDRAAADGADAPQLQFAAQRAARVPRRRDSQCRHRARLFERFPTLPEGDLSRLRANLVRQDSLHQQALALSLGDHLRLGEGEQKSGGQQRPSILADALEALFGALWLDAGFDAASEVIVRLYDGMLDQLTPGQDIKDAKTRLQEYLQGRRLALPQYALPAPRARRTRSISGSPASSIPCASAPRAAAAAAGRPNRWPPSARWKAWASDE
jgi:ribonuclease-3